MNSHSKEIARRMFHVIEDGREFIEASVVFRGEPTIRQFDVVPGSLGTTLATAKQWQSDHYEELKSQFKRDYNKKAREEKFAAAVEEVFEQTKADAFERMVARVTHNDSIVRAAKDDVRRVWQSYGPALVERVMYVPAFQWI